MYDWRRPEMVTLVTNKNLYKWKLKDSELYICSFCREEIETIEHMFLGCEVIKIKIIHIQNYPYTETHPYLILYFC